MNLIDLTFNDNKFNEKNDLNMKKTCRNITDPVTFNSPESYIPLFNWKSSPKLYSFSIEFQTVENHGILAYILGATNSYNNNTKNTKTDSFLVALNRDFFALEIHNRFLNVYINYGSTYYRHEVVHEHVSSGKSHQIQVEFNGNFVTLKFDQKASKTIKIDSGNGVLELQEPLVIGGVYPNHTGASFSNPSKHIPPYFLSGILNHGYVGCIHDVIINGEIVNLTHYASLESVSGISTDICAAMPNQCSIGHCMNDGICLEGWNRFICDCTSTGFNGPVCNQR
jgi:neurexin